MSIKLELPKVTDTQPRITVMGVGGAGGNAINNMIASGLSGVDFIAANTDAQALAMSSAERRLQLGVHLTEGLGAGARPEIGQAAAEEALDDIRSELSGSHMVFIAAGMGGGTAASVIARCAREMGILAVGIVSKPFHFEGTRRMRIAEAGIDGLRSEVDTLIVIPNQNLFRIANERTTFAEAFVLADQVLYSGIACIVDLILKDGLINLDFADVRAVMEDMGSAVMGTGEAEGGERAVLAAEEAITNPLLDDMALIDAEGVLISIVGGSDMTLFEVDEAANRIRQDVNPDANIIVGATFDADFGERLRVSLVAAGMDRSRRVGLPGRETGTAPVDASVEAGPAAQAAASHTPAETAPIAAAGATEAADKPLPISALPPPLPTQTAPVVASEPAPLSNVGPRPAAGVAGDRAKAFEQALKGRADEFAERSAEASLPVDTEQSAGARRPSDPTIASDRPVWEAGNGVTIEPVTGPARPRDVTRSLAQPTTPATQSSASVPSTTTSAGQPDHAPRFEPAMPEEARSETSRFPTVDEFPEHAQREYRAKVAGMPEVETVSSVPRMRSSGLFKRLTGIGSGGESKSPS
ncbi:MAG: cell division protein FtsZ, partial [Pseudomonadota bacterium]